MEELLCEIAEFVKQWEATGISRAEEILQKIVEVRAEYLSTFEIYQRNLATDGVNSSTSEVEESYNQERRN